MTEVVCAGGVIGLEETFNKSDLSDQHVGKRLIVCLDIVICAGGI